MTAGVTEHTGSCRTTPHCLLRASAQRKGVTEQLGDQGWVIGGDWGKGGGCSYQPKLNHKQYPMQKREEESVA